MQKIYDYSSLHGYVLPSVFQGNYNAVSRHLEADLFPLLRRLNIRFYAYSPIAGGFLVKSPDAIIKGTERRFNNTLPSGKLYSKLYIKPSLLSALTEWEDIAKAAGISKSALAYRWIAYHSALKSEYGDAIIIGASSPAQLKETLAALADGPLQSEIVERIEKVWESVKDEAPVDNYHG